MRSYFLHGGIFCLEIYMSVSKPSICFWKRVQLSGVTSCLFTTLVWQVIERVYVSTALDFPGDMSHCLVLAGFFQGLLPPWSQSVLWNWVKKCTFEYYRKYEVKMTRMLFKFIIYPSCERTLNNGRVKSKIGNRLVMTIDFTWLYTSTFHLFSVLCQRRYCCWNIESELATWKIVFIMQRW